MANGDDYGNLQQPAGGYAGAGGANASTGYGDAQNPPSPYDKQSDAAQVFDFIKQVKDDLKAKEINVSLEGANLIDMKSHKNHLAFEQFGFVAWTNSSKEVYINLLFLQAMEDPKNARAVALIAVRHEIEHVIQFKKKGGKEGGRPDDFKEMISFESQAYAKTVTFMDLPNTNTYLTKTGATKQFLDGIRAGFIADATDFGGRMIVIAASNPPPSNDDNRDWLTANKELPPIINNKQKYEIGDLY